jgi:hypothetical protein
MVFLFNFACMLLLDYGDIKKMNPRMQILFLLIVRNQ